MIGRGVPKLSWVKQASNVSLHRPFGTSTNKKVLPTVEPESGKKKSLFARHELFNIAFNASLPMIGFGIVDQLIMIRAGEIIDSTIGVTLGISTLAAAAIGQMCSDTSGVVFGSTIESLAHKYKKIKTVILTREQVESTTYRLTQTAGRGLGILLGCFLGMSQLLFIDTEKADKLRKQKQINSIFQTVMAIGPKLFDCERATLFVYDETKQELWSKAIYGVSDVITLNSEQKSFVTWIFNNKAIINTDNPQNDPRYNSHYDDRYSNEISSVLGAPVLDKNGNVIGIIILFNKLPQVNEQSNNARFNLEDERMIEMMSHHISLFMQSFDYGAYKDSKMIYFEENEDSKKNESSTDESSSKRPDEYFNWELINMILPTRSNSPDSSMKSNNIDFIDSNPITSETDTFTNKNLPFIPIISLITPILKYENKLLFHEKNNNKDYNMRVEGKRQQYFRANSGHYAGQPTDFFNKFQNPVATQRSTTHRTSQDSASRTSTISIKTANDNNQTDSEHNRGEEFFFNNSQYPLIVDSVVLGCENHENSNDKNYHSRMQSVSTQSPYYNGVTDSAVNPPINDFQNPLCNLEIGSTSGGSDDEMTSSFIKNNGSSSSSSRPPNNSLNTLKTRRKGGIGRRSSKTSLLNTTHKRNKSRANQGSKDNLRINKDKTNSHVRLLSLESSSNAPSLQTHPEDDPAVFNFFSQSKLLPSNVVKRSSDGELRFPYYYDSTNDEQHASSSRIVDVER